MSDGEEEGGGREQVDNPSFSRAAIFRVIDPAGIGNACLSGARQPHGKNRKSASRVLA